ncbi:MAG: DUF5675 family protein [Ferruginibacter sp.]
MNITIIRTYFPAGTNGILQVPNLRSPLYTIELPWLQNQHGISCIPEGQYRLEKRYSPGRKSHIILMGVKDRSLILIHPANDALKELRGCIAPVSELTGEGKGIASVKAFNTLKNRVYAAMEKEPVYLTIKSK